MKLLNLIVGVGRQALKLVDGWLWLRLELLAKWILTHSGRHVMPAQRHRKAVHSEAWCKGVIVCIPRQFRGTLSWN